jgi:hypothetical protein
LTLERERERLAVDELRRSGVSDAVEVGKGEEKETHHVSSDDTGTDTLSESVEQGGLTGTGLSHHCTEMGISARKN